MVMIQGESPGQRAAGLHQDRDHDDALLARLRAGDEAAFRALVDRHRPWLVRLCTRLLGHDAHAAEDAAQESLLKLHAAARRDGRPLRVRPWLTVVARNTCVDEQRRRRPDLPGELPERAAPGDDPFQLDAALTDAWSQLSGRHREVLYLREVLGFSYKEIGAVMDLTMAATEALVFRARAALRREYERSGGTSFGCVLLGLQLSRLGLDRRREVGVTDGLTNAAVSDAGLQGLSSRMAHFLSTSLPGCGEQAMAKVLSVAAGVVMAAASVIPGLGPFSDAPPAAAAAAPVTAGTDRGPTGEALAVSPPAGVPGVESKPMTLKALLGGGVPADWAPTRARTDGPPATTTEQLDAEQEARSPRVTPLRDAVRSDDRPRLRHPDGAPEGTGPLRTILASRPDRPERPAHPLRSLLADPVPFPTDPFPAFPTFPTSPVRSLIEELPLETLPTPAEDGTVPEPETRPTIRGSLQPVIATVTGDDAALLRRRNG
jgi:RNA polymerase sigma-70 factor, ECF subfamily